MPPLLRVLILLWTLHPAGTAAEWFGFARSDGSFEGKEYILVRPTQPAVGRPWIWRTEFFGHEPQADRSLLSNGWHVAYLRVSDQYGAPVAIRAMHAFHEHLMATEQLAKRAVLEGFSRGGLYAFNYAAEHPRFVRALYLDAPVLDIRSWPGGKGAGKGDPGCWRQCLTAYGIEESGLDRFQSSPLDRIAPVAAARIPIISICGAADTVVPFAENTRILEQRYQKLNAPILVIAKPGLDHHPHSLPDPKPIVDFLLQHSAPESPEPGR
jgi:pimeloyl-ACP methyl ester carboxylesterase